MTRILFVSLLALFFALPNHAAERSSLNGQAHGIGLGGTVFNTWGLNYRRYFDPYWGMTVNLGGWISNSVGRLGTAVGGTYTFAHYSFEHSKKFHNSSIRVYGVGYIAGIYGHDWLPGATAAPPAHYFDLGFGIGPGAEFFFNRHLAVHAELPWMTFFRMSKNKSGFESSHPHIGGGISYYF